MITFLLTTLQKDQSLEVIQCRVSLLGLEAFPSRIISLNQFNALPEQNFKRYSSSLTFFERHYGKYVFEERVDKLRKAVILAYPDKDIRNNTALTASDVNDFYYENLSN